MLVAQETGRFGGKVGEEDEEVFLRLDLTSQDLNAIFNIGLPPW